jgi:hypothetical protein
MSRMIVERGWPLPVGRHLILELVAEWNRKKNLIDMYSRWLKNVQAAHSHLSPIDRCYMDALNHVPRVQRVPNLRFGTM